ncbi:DUF3099 domain-containing protein [Microbacter sp. GSS18]|nr:DUF3099 domain-containing protein [Microbacter sp. GSS18]
MKSSHRPQSATSLPRAPRDEASARSRKYLIMMAIRVVCFILMVVITPYGWYTWVFGLAAVFLPYVAVVTANVASDVRSTEPEAPEARALPTAPTAPPADVGDRVIRIEETPRSGRAQDVDDRDAPA